MLEVIVMDIIDFLASLDDDTFYSLSNIPNGLEDAFKKHSEKIAIKSTEDITEQQVDWL